jgi:hypothetical protein
LCAVLCTYGIPFYHHRIFEKKADRQLDIGMNLSPDSEIDGKLAKVILGEMVTMEALEFDLFALPLIGAQGVNKTNGVSMMAKRTIA